MEKPVYLLEDDESISELIKCTFDINGISLKAYASVKEFKAAFAARVPSVVLLDIMLGDGDGISVLKEIKETQPQVICIMLSAMGKETDKVKCLNLGADDYITKPFGILELTARVKVALRRVSGKESLLRRGDLAMNTDTMTVTLRGEKLDLNRKEFKLLHFFMINENKVLSRDEILQEVWGFDELESRTLDNHIARLRKLGVTYIETVFGVGYKFSAEGAE